MCTVPDSAPMSGGILNRLRQRFLKRANLPPPFTTKDFHCHLQVISKGPKTTLFHPCSGKESQGALPLDSLKPGTHDSPKGPRPGRSTGETPPLAAVTHL